MVVCFMLTLCLNRIVGAQSDIKALKKTAAQGDAKAQYDLAEKFFNGQGLPRNSATALSWYLKAAEQGYAKAQQSREIPLLSIISMPFP
jgi:TPR repeat protein